MAQVDARDVISSEPAGLGSSSELQLWYTFHIPRAQPGLAALQARVWMQPFPIQGFFFPARR
jgi:hypothetical protein